MTSSKSKAAGTTLKLPMKQRRSVLRTRKRFPYLVLRETRWIKRFCLVTMQMSLCLVVRKTTNKSTGLQELTLLTNQHSTHSLKAMPLTFSLPVSLVLVSRCTQTLRCGSTAKALPQSVIFLLVSSFSALKDVSCVSKTSSLHVQKQKAISSRISTASMKSWLLASTCGLHAMSSTRCMERAKILSLIIMV